MELTCCSCILWAITHFWIRWTEINWIELNWIELTKFVRCVIVIITSPWRCLECNMLVRILWIKYIIIIDVRWLVIYIFWIWSKHGIWNILKYSKKLLAFFQNLLFLVYLISCMLYFTAVTASINTGTTLFLYLSCQMLAGTAQIDIWV